MNGKKYLYFVYLVSLLQRNEYVIRKAHDTSGMELFGGKYKFDLQIYNGYNF